jgi:hypothetical protein
MIRSRITAAIAGGVATLVLLLGSILPVSAATEDSGGNGLKVSPVRSDLTISPGQTQTVTVTVQNVTSSPADLRVIVNDFVAGKDESGQPAIILDANKFAPSHSLKRYIADIPNVSLKAGEEKGVKVNISIPKDAAGGGYFGAIRFAPASSTTDKNVTLAASVGSLILVRVPGDIKDDLRLVSLDVRRGTSAQVLFTSNKDLKAAARFENKGNVQEQPFGKVVLKKGSKVLQTVEINNTEPRGNVLPDSIRRFEVDLNKVGSFGKYTVQGNFGYGTSGQLLSGQTTFYVIPLALIILAIVLVLVILFLIFVLPRLVRRYNRSVVRKASRRR